MSAPRVTQAANTQSINNKVFVTPVISGGDLTIGAGFTAKAFKEKDFLGLMDPLVMVDHYTMTESTFGAHPHAGLSAVSVLFENTEGKFNNRDSLGNNFDLSAGDLYWLKAGSGVIHDEAPRPGAKTHGLQVFVNLPAKQKRSAPASLHVKAEDIPVIGQDGYRVRVVLGEHNGVQAAQSPSIPMTILDGTLKAESTYNIPIKQGEHAWVYAVLGGLRLFIDGRPVTLEQGQAIAVANNSSAAIVIEFENKACTAAKFAFFSAAPIKESFMQKGPLIMSTLEEIEAVEAEYKAGKFGQVA